MSKFCGLLGIAATQDEHVLLRQGTRLIVVLFELKSPREIGRGFGDGQQLEKDFFFVGARVGISSRPRSSHSSWANHSLIQEGNKPR